MAKKEFSKFEIQGVLDTTAKFEIFRKWGDLTKNVRVENL